MVTFLNDELKFGFIHVPKTGGMTVTKFFFDSNRDPKIREASERNVNFAIHSGISDVQRALGCEFKNYFTFAFYRNTFDWLHSLYKYIARTPSHPKHKEVVGKTFEHYVFRVAPTFLRPQRPLIAPEGKNLVTRLEDYNNFATTFPEILLQLGFEDPDFTSHNVSKSKKNYQDAYSQKMVEKVSELYADDIAFFNFSF